jgi:YwiC-like protein
MLYVPFLLGCLVGRNSSWRLTLLFVAVTSLFLSRGPLLAWFRVLAQRKSAAGVRGAACSFLGVGLLAGLALVMASGLCGLVVIGAGAAVLLALNVWQSLQKEERTITGELLAISGLSLTAPAAYYTSRGVWDRTGLVLWGLSCLFFASSVLYVKLRVSAAHERKSGETAKLRWACAGYHLGTLALAATHPAALFAFFLISGRALWFVARPGAHLNLKRVGWSEAAYSAVFLVSAGLATW